jgi:hypothetical protein
MNRKTIYKSTLTPKELNMNKRLFMFNSFGVSENWPFIFLFMFNSFGVLKTRFYLFLIPKAQSASFFKDTL